MKRTRFITWGIIAGVLLATIGFAALRRADVSASGEDIPFAEVKHGELDLKVYTTGELRANHSMMLAAPPIGGGSLQITRLLHTGTPVKKGDVVIEFDPSEQHYKLEQSRSELLQAEQDIIKAKPAPPVQAPQPKAAFLNPPFNLR